MYASELSQRDYRNFNAIERACSVFSLIGCIFIIFTFSFSKSFRKPITRLIFFASFGNMMTNVATLMARSYIEVPSSPGCQLQGFLIQMFMPADAYWTLAMAVNVYLTFFRKYDARKLKKMEIPYLLVCYGAPFVIALTYVFIYNPRSGRMYGDALLWCWVSTGWDVWRIATFYGPVWVTIFLTFFIYIRTGRQIYHKYKTLRSLNSKSREPEPLLITEPFSTKTTEVYITSEIVSTNFGADALGHRASAAVGAPQAAYTVEITSDANATKHTTPAHSHHDDVDEEEDGNEIKPVTSADLDFTPPSSPISTMSPYSPNSISSPITRRTTTTTSVRMTSDKVRRNRRRLAVYEANNAAWSYTKCALLFFTALLITWIPSTANRVYSVIYQKQLLLGLEYAAALVLPLQGFWNGLIYVLTTRRACNKLIRDGLGYFTRSTQARPREPERTVQIQNRHNSWTGPSRQVGRDRNSYMMGFVPSHGKAGLGLPIEAYERI